MNDDRFDSMPDPSFRRIFGEDLWDVTVHTLHRMIFAIVVGLTAVVISALLWVASLPWVTWNLAKYMMPERRPGLSDELASEESVGFQHDAVLAVSDSLGSLGSLKLVSQESLEVSQRMSNRAQANCIIDCC